MHILILPSEEFVPDYAPLAGIFQYHQAMVLQQSGHKVAAISIQQSFSIPMIAKGLLARLTRRKVGNKTDDYSFLQLLHLGYNKIAKPEVFISAYQKDGITVYDINGFYYWKPRENHNHFGWMQAGMSALKEYIAKHGKPDVVHAHNAIYAGMLARKIKAAYGIPYILTEHSTAFAQGQVTDRKILQRVQKAYENSEALFAVSQPFCNLLNQRFGIDRFQRLPNVLDPYLEDRQYAPSPVQKSEFVFLNIALFHPKKDHLTLLKSFQNVVAQRPEARLWIGGGGELENELKDFVSRQGLKEKVVFLGTLNRDEVVHYLSSCDCFVLSSKFETFGVVVIEAMLFGKPVVVTECGGPEDFVKESMGIVVEKQNHEQLAKAMIRMMNGYSSYNAKAIRDYTVQHFGKEKFLKQLTSIYEDVV